MPGAHMIRVLTFTEVGGHRVNEDAVEVRPHPADAGCWLCCLADGQGGQPGGGPAARLACRTALDLALAHDPERLTDPDAWPSLLRQADQAVEADRDAGFTTLIGLAITRGQLTGASCGDSAVLAVSAGKAVEVTSRQWKDPPVGS